MNKYLKFILFTFGSVLILFGIYQTISYFLNRAQIEPQTKMGVIRTHQKVDFKTNGEVIKMNNFSRYPVRRVDSGVVYIADHLDFGIMYWPEEDKFRIPIMSQPVRENSLQAELELLQLLDISKEDACKLNIVITGSYLIDPAFETRSEYQLSFCQGIHL